MVLISSEISVYSTTLGFEFLLQNTPTLSSGLALTTDFPAAIHFLVAAIATKIGSTIFTKGLSTGPINTHSIFLLFISSNAPLFSIDSKTPPCPSAANFRNPSSFTNIFPSLSIIGNSP